MPYLIGGGLALGVCGLIGTVARMDRERAFYTTIAMVVATYYVLFAAMAEARIALLIEVLLMAPFLAGAVLGFKRGMWIVAALLCAHGVLDLFHAQLVHNPGVPAWWPPFCLGFDVTAGAYLGWILHGTEASVSA
jgi:hypothetical protein